MSKTIEPKQSMFTFQHHSGPSRAKSSFLPDPTPVIGQSSSVIGHGHSIPDSAPPPSELDPTSSRDNIAFALDNAREQLKGSWTDDAATRLEIIPESLKYGSLHFNRRSRKIQ